MPTKSIVEQVIAAGTNGDNAPVVSINGEAVNPFAGRIKSGFSAIVKGGKETGKYQKIVSDFLQWIPVGTDVAEIQDLLLDPADRANGKKVASVYSAMNMYIRSHELPLVCKRRNLLVELGHKVPSATEEGITE